MNLLFSLQSEWLKTKRSTAAWLSLTGGFFIPVIYLIGFLKNHSSINLAIKGEHIWENHFMQLWQNMAGFLLPMCVILASSLITQLEYKNNTWKQLHTTPQSLTTIFFAKFAVIILMTFQFFVFFNIGIIISGAIPCLIFDKHLPDQAFPYLLFIKGNIKFFIACLPIIAIQYLLSLQFKNFLVPIGIGLLGLIGSLIALSWKYIFLSPYSYGPLILMIARRAGLIANVYVLAVGYFILLMTLSYFLYINKKEKG